MSPVPLQYLLPMQDLPLLPLKSKIVDIFLKLKENDLKNEKVTNCVDDRFEFWKQPGDTLLHIWQKVEKNVRKYD